MAKGKESKETNIGIILWSIYYDLKTYNGLYAQREANQEKLNELKKEKNGKSEPRAGIPFYSGGRHLCLYDKKHFSRYKKIEIIHGIIIDIIPIE